MIFTGSSKKLSETFNVTFRDFFLESDDRNGALVFFFCKAAPLFCVEKYNPPWTCSNRAQLSDSAKLSSRSMKQPVKGQNLDPLLGEPSLQKLVPLQTTYTTYNGILASFQYKGEKLMIRCMIIIVFLVFLDLKRKKSLFFCSLGFMYIE